jgi:hypothetical protein
MEGWVSRQRWLQKLTEKEERGSKRNAEVE